MKDRIADMLTTCAFTVLFGTTVKTGFWRSALHQGTSVRH